MPRLTPIRPEAMSGAQWALHEAIVGGKRGPGMRGEDGALIGPFNAMLLNPHVGDRVQRLGEALRFDISLPRNVIEVATLVVGSHWRAQFEWWAHERLARQAGVSEAVIAAIKRGERPDFSNDDESGAYDVASELYRTQRLTDATYAHAVRRFGRGGGVRVDRASGLLQSSFSTIERLRGTLAGGRNAAVQRLSMRPQGRGGTRMVLGVWEQSKSSEIHLMRATLHYGNGRQRGAPALDNASLWIRRGETMSVVGPTGCGKSSLLRVIAGLERPETGDLTFDGEDVSALSPSQRAIGLVFQTYALYPHFKVHGNIAFYFRLRRWKSEAIDARVMQTSRIMGIGFEKLLGRMPRSLSGGEKQRVALARCLSHSPRVLLLDEPFSNLDAALRLQTRSEVKKLIDQFGLTTIFVTHDQGEAVSMGHRLAVMRQGRIEQVGTYQELYHEPANMFVAGFLGSPPMNFFPAQRWGESLTCDVGGTSLAVPLAPGSPNRLPDGARIFVGWRPEHLRPVEDEFPALPCTVDAVDISLSDATQLLHLVHGSRTFCAKTDLQKPVRKAETLRLHFAPQHAYYFDQNENRL